MTAQHRLSGTRLFLALLALATALGPRPAFAQSADQQLEDLGASQDEIIRYRSLRTTGDRITFCVNAESITADFDRDLARALTETLLLDYRVSEFTTVPPTPPYDYRLLVDDLVVFRLLLNRCDAILGFTLLTNYPLWMAPSPSYLSTRTVFAVRAGEYNSLESVPKTKLLGSRGFSIADNYLMVYTQVLPRESRWQRIAFTSNKDMIDGLIDGRVEAILVWEPALLAYQADHPDAPAIDVLPSLPFTVPPTDLVLAERPQDPFVNSYLSQAIAELRRTGEIDRLAAAHGLIAPPAP